jgi:apocytochrome f
MVKIPYDKQIKQVQANGKKGDLNVGMVLPEGLNLLQRIVFQNK